MNVIDILMVGQINETAIAAVGIATQFIFMFIVTQYGVHSGIAIFTAQYWGKQDLSRIKHLSGMGILAGLFIAALFSTVALLFPHRLMAVFSTDPQVLALGIQYLEVAGVCFPLFALTFSFMFNMRAMGFVRVPMVASMVSVLVNILLNYLLIFGKFGCPAMGVAGAAVATTIAKGLEAIILISIIYAKNYPLAGTLREMAGFPGTFLKKVIATCWPVFLNELAWVTGVSLYKVVYARIGTDSIAAVNIVFSLEEFLFIPFWGIFHGGSVMIGNAIGAGRYDQAFSCGKFLLKAQLAVSLTTGMTMILARDFILSFYQISPATHANAHALMLVTGLTLWAKTTNFTNIVSVLRGGGDTRFGCFLDMTGVWGIGVPMAIFAAFYLNLPVYWVMALVTVEEIFKLSLGIPRFLSGKWIRDLVRD
jgi:putative MATE family efflux protein